MANLHFATRAYPTFGTVKKPKPASAWKGSVYYWWWEYLRRNEGYAAFCKRNGTGKGTSKYAALYEDFGDVHATEFKTWWNEGDRGGRLFAEKAADTVVTELTHDKLVAMGEWDTKKVMVIIVPLSQNMRHLTQRFSAILKKRHSGKRGKRLLPHSEAKYKLQAQFKIASLKASLAAYDLSKEVPKLPLWKIALKAGLAKTVAREITAQKSMADAAQRNALSVAASRAIKRAAAMIESTGIGKFPLDMRERSVKKVATKTNKGGIHLIKK